VSENTRVLELYLSHNFTYARVYAVTGVHQSFKLVWSRRFYCWPGNLSFSWNYIYGYTRRFSLLRDL